MGLVLHVFCVIINARTHNNKTGTHVRLPGAFGS